MSFTNKIDFALVISVKNANPNGDPLNGNRPRENYDGFGEISDVCLKRKIRNRLMSMGEEIFVQSDDNKLDEYKSLSERASAGLKGVEKDKDLYSKAACEKWFDVRAFGQVFAFKSKDKGDGVSVPVRGPVTIQTAVSALPIEINSMQITKSVNSEPNDKKSSDTMGTKHRVNHGLYVTYGSINHQIAERTGFSDADAEQIKKALITLFENDETSARPAGSMEVVKLIWWKHNCFSGQYSSAKVHRLLCVKPKIENPKTSDDYDINIAELDSLAFEVCDGY